MYIYIYDSAVHRFNHYTTRTTAVLEVDASVAVLEVDASKICWKQYLVFSRSFPSTFALASR